MGLYDYPEDPEATTSYYQPPTRVSSQRAASARPTSSARATSKTPGGTDAGGSIDWAGAATGAIGLAGQAYGMSQQRFNFGSVNQSQTDPNSAPAYTAGQLYNEVSGAKPQGASGGEVLSGAAQGAKIGTSILPGIGTAVGAVGGAIVSVLGGQSRRNKQAEEKRKKMKELTAAQGTYNQQAQDYRAHQNQLYDYYNQNNAEGREYNVLRSRMVS